MEHFIAYSKTNDATNVAELFSGDVVRLHGIPRFLISDGDDIKFSSHF